MASSNAQVGGTAYIGFVALTKRLIAAVYRILVGLTSRTRVRMVSLFPGTGSALLPGTQPGFTNSQRPPAFAHHQSAGTPQQPLQRTLHRARATLQNVRVAHRRRQI